MPEQFGPTVLHDALSIGQVSYSLFLRRLFNASYAHVRTGHWQTSARDFDAFPGAVDYNAKHDGVREILVGGDGWFAQGTIGTSAASLAVAASSAEALAERWHELARLLPHVKADEAQRVPVIFWTQTPNGPNARTRMLDVPRWDEVEPNYVTATHGELLPLMHGFAPASGGQLVLWHGPPGTGKTYALRALGWEWREWCDLHYIADPEVFFGDQAAYMLDVLLTDLGNPSGDDEPPPDTLDPRAADGRWKLLVLEDTGELMASDAKTRSGQGLSRLLNVVDGLIGQGLRIMVLVTTNEEIRELHPAVQRPGRCAALVHFHALPCEDARAWLEERGWDTDEARERLTGNTYAVADLYAVLDERDTTRDRERQPAGFVA